MEEVVGALLKQRRLKLAVAESCTGGLIGARITNIPGSSEYFERGAVTYSNAGEDGNARCSGGTDRASRRGKQRGRRGNGAGHQERRLKPPRAFGDRYRGTGRRERAEAGGPGLHGARKQPGGQRRRSTGSWATGSRSGSGRRRWRWTW